MSLNWLFGPRTIQTESSILFRSLTIDCDAVRDVAAMIVDECGSVGTIDPQLSGLTPVPFNGPDLENASARYLDTLQLRDDGSTFVLSLMRDQRATINYQRERSMLANKVVEHLLSEGTPRPEIAFLYRLGYLVPLGLVASWIWFLSTSDSDLSLKFAGTLVIAVCTAVSWTLPREIKARLGQREFVGIRILAQSRLETRRRRADRNANLKLSAITLPVGAALGAVATLLLK